MKKCNLCGRTYTDQSLNFCLDDGGTLVNVSDDAPQTIFMDQSRVTSENSWTNNSPFNPPVSQPISQWQPNQPVSPFMSANSQFEGQDKTLPTISIVLGALSMFFFCCYGGFYLGLPAIIIGFLGLSNTKNNPSQYGGRTLAIVGMVLGGVSLLGIIIMLILGIMGNILK